MGDPYDPRAIANLILDARKAVRLQTRHIELQKLLFFCHESFLLKFRRPLVKGYFEAWQYGPVHPVVYRSFKRFGADAITQKANAIDVRSGRITRIAVVKEPETLIHVFETVSKLSAMSTGQLIKRSHAPGGPWDYIVNKSKTSVALGMRITDDVVLRTFEYHMRYASADDATEFVPDEDTPIAAD